MILSEFCGRTELFTELITFWITPGLHRIHTRSLIHCSLWPSKTGIVDLDDCRVQETKKLLTPGWKYRRRYNPIIGQQSYHVTYFLISHQKNSSKFGRGSTSFWCTVIVESGSSLNALFSRVNFLITRYHYNILIVYSRVSRYLTVKKQFPSICFKQWSCGSFLSR
jgi:hypothetical protein